MASIINAHVSVSPLATVKRWCSNRITLADIPKLFAQQLVCSIFKQLVIPMVALEVCKLLLWAFLAPTLLLVQAKSLKMSLKLSP